VSEDLSESGKKFFTCGRDDAEPNNKRDFVFDKGLLWGATARRLLTIGPLPAMDAEAAPERKGLRVGYLRVSALDQKEVRQLDGMELDKRFTDKVSGRDRNRPGLERMIEFVREGDTVFCHSMDRLARNQDDLRLLVKKLTGKGVKVCFVKESLTFTGEDSPMANLLLSVMGAIAEFERELIKERQREGIALAKKAGVYKGRKRTLTAEQAVLVHKVLFPASRPARSRRESAEDAGLSTACGLIP